MTREALRDGLISEQTIRDALVQARGDLFVGACYLSVTARELDSYIRSSEDLQAFVGAIETVKRDAGYDKLSADQFADRLEVLTRSYRIEALDIIHDMARMSFDSAAMAEVKLKAAVQLRGAQTEKVASGDQMAVLSELNELYQLNAPRIKSIRAVQIEYKE